MPEVQVPNDVVSGESPVLQKAPSGEWVTSSDGVKVCVIKGAAQSPLTDVHKWSPGCDEEVYKRVQTIITDLEKDGEAAALGYAQKLDKWPVESKTLLLTKEEIAEQTSCLTEEAKRDVHVQIERVRAFAQMQKDHTTEFECELLPEQCPGVITGQKLIPVNGVGCYIPGGRYSHVSSAAMTIATAKVAGVKSVVACSPPMQGTTRIHPGTLYAMNAAGADHILVCGGAHAIGSMAFGLFTGVNVDMIVGPGNSYVAEAKRFLYGRVGIDMFAGPTEILVLADDTADPRIVASDLVSQAEHGLTSPAWLITTSMRVAQGVADWVPKLVAALPKDNAANVSWPDRGQVLYVETRDDMRRLSDQYAAEHLEVHCADLDWWLANLTNYGSLFVGEETCVSYGDKISGPNHALPTLRGSRYSGGLSVDKYTKKLTYQKKTKEANRYIGPLCARLCRLEGMEAHARAGDDRLEKYFPDEKFDIANPQPNL